MFTERSMRAVLFMFISFAAMLSLAQAARGATFTVNDVRDLDDADTVIEEGYDGRCDALSTTGLQCTLRAAIQEANVTPAADEIRVAADIGGGATTVLNAGRGTDVVLAITNPLTIDACRNFIEPAGPCFGIQSPREVESQPATALVADAADVTIRGIAVHGASRGILVSSAAPRFRLERSYLGFSVAGVSAGNVTGLRIEADDATIGGATGQGNVISANTTGIDVFGGDRTVILGNAIGTLPNGNGEAANGKGIVVGGTTGKVASGARIGDTLASAPSQTAACDGACNTIASAVAGVELGTGAGAPTGVTIAGNHIGLSRDGSSTVTMPTGIVVGDAPDLTIGGASDAARNLISATSHTIDADRFPPNLLVRYNRLGTNPAGNFRFRAGAMRVASPELAPAAIKDNVISLGESYGIQLRGKNAAVVNNLVGVALNGGDIGQGEQSNAIRLLGSETAPADGNVLKENIVGNGGHSGIALYGASGNRLEENIVGTGPSGGDHGNGAFGVLVDRAGAEGPTSEGNLIGGDGEGDMVISNHRRAAIAIRAGNEGNVVGAVRGGNISSEAVEAEFIDLGDDGRGNVPSGPAGGLQPPRILVAGRVAIVGTGVPGAMVRVYTKDEANRGELDNLLIRTTVEVDSTGLWRLTAPEDLAAGTRLAATQTRVQGTSELSEAEVTGAATSSTQPVTTIDGPAATNDPTPTMQLLSDQAGSRFACRFDGQTIYGPCASPYTFPFALVDGFHTLRAIAIGPSGTIDPSPADFTFLVDTVTPEGEGEGEEEGEGGDGEGGNGGNGDGGGGPAIDDNPKTSVSPQTSITKAPKKRVRAKRGKALVRVRFVSSLPGSGFRCAVDRKPEKTCSSPLRLRLKPGKHVIAVTAVDGALRDPTPALVRFKVVR